MLAPHRGSSGAVGSHSSASLCVWWCTGVQKHVLDLTLLQHVTHSVWHPFYWFHPWMVLLDPVCSVGQGEGTGLAAMQGLWWPCMGGHGSSSCFVAMQQPRVHSRLHEQPLALLQRVLHLCAKLDGGKISHAFSSTRAKPVWWRCALLWNKAARRGAQNSSSCHGPGWRGVGELCCQSQEHESHPTCG